MFVVECRVCVVWFGFRVDKQNLERVNRDECVLLNERYTTCCLIPLWFVRLRIRFISLVKAKNIMFRSFCLVGNTYRQV
jgi:hypothetical protein